MDENNSIFDSKLKSNEFFAPSEPVCVKYVSKNEDEESRAKKIVKESADREKNRQQLLQQCLEYLQLECNNSVLNRDTFRRAILNKEVLSRLFKLFDENGDGQLSPEWIQFIKGRLLEEKQCELAEFVESAAYICCGDNFISFEGFYQIFHFKGMAEKIFRYIDKDSNGIITPYQVIEVFSSLSNVRNENEFNKENLEWLEQLFRQTVGNEKEIRRDDFKKILITKNPFFTERVFQIFDCDNSGTISLREFLDAMRKFSGQSPEDKIKFLFRVYDLDGDGLIQHRELQHVMRACMEENGMQFSEDQVEDLTMALFEDADAECRGAITYADLKNQLEKHEGLLQNLSISIDRWLVPPKPTCCQKSPSCRKWLSYKPYQLSFPYMKNNYVYLSFLSIFLCVNAFLFAGRVVKYRRHNIYVVLARGCGQCLNFNCTFTLVLMLRHCVTFLRTRGASSFLPLDQHIYLHKLTGILICFQSIVHTLAHLLNLYFYVIPDGEINSDELTMLEWLFTTKPELFGLIAGCANITGVILLLILTVMFICSQPFVRRGGSFEIFYWTHLLYVPFWILLIFHGPNYWKWFAVPGLMYLCEKAFGFWLTSSRRGHSYVSSGLLLPSKVTHLVIKRPPHFDFHPGDYIFVNLPAIANYEWHPFTISSAPEQQDYMWLHIRAVGEWTNRLYSYFEKHQAKLHNIDEALPTVQSNADKIDNNFNDAINKERPLLQMKKSLERTISGNGSHTIHGKSVTCKRPDLTNISAGYTNQAFSEKPEDFRKNSVTFDTSVNLNDFNKQQGIQASNLHKLLMMKKTPLTKANSMPDMDIKIKKKERLLVLREYMRSESERSFDQCHMKRARLQSLGMAYLSPQNKSLAQSFRYMRHKPTIIAFKTPSMECYEQSAVNKRASAASIMSVKTVSNDCATIVEEGRRMSTRNDLTEQENDECANEVGINFPVGKPLQIFMDGPYGAPSSHIFRAQHAVLIATGIGVTPFASILQSIMHRYWNARHTCPSCSYTWASDIPPTVMHLRKVDFFWINRDQRSFEWFVNLLSQLEIEQAELGGAMERFLDMHMYITSALQRTDMKAVGLQLALDLLHEKEKRDLITGLKTRTNAGRPNWDKVFQQIMDQKKGKVTVFYCGPPELGKSLRIKCDLFGFRFRKEVF